MAVETSINAEQPKPEDLEIAEKQPSRTGSVGEELKVGQVELLDEAEIFLQQNGVSHSQLRELLADQDAQKKLVRRVSVTLYNALPPWPLGKRMPWCSRC